MFSFLPPCLKDFLWSDPLPKPLAQSFTLLMLSSLPYLGSGFMLLFFFSFFFFLKYFML